MRIITNTKDRVDSSLKNRMEVIKEDINKAVVDKHKCKSCTQDLNNRDNPFIILKCLHYFCVDCTKGFAYGTEEIYL